MRKKLPNECLVCGTLLLGDNWHIFNKLKRYRICKNCYRGRIRKTSLEHQKKRKKENPELFKENHRKSHLKSLYGITIDEYDKLLKNQNEVCAICGKKETRRNQFGIKRLAVDHNHITGKIRGLLCSRCNLAIGALCSDECGDRLFFNAIQYLGDRNED